MAMMQCCGTGWSASSAATVCRASTHASCPSAIKAFSASWERAPCSAAGKRCTTADTSRMCSPIATPMRRAACGRVDDGGSKVDEAAIIAYFHDWNNNRTLSAVEKTPYGRFWMGKSESAGTGTNDMLQPG